MNTLQMEPHPCLLSRVVVLLCCSILGGVPWPNNLSMVAMFATLDQVSQSVCPLSVILDFT